MTYKCRNMIFSSLLSVACAAIAIPVVFAAECAECKSLQAPPFPETGAWSNVSEPGSGFMLEVQNGRLAGGWFGYSQTGSPEWRLLQGPLELRTGEDNDVFWALETTTETFSGGACLGCEYVAPSVEGGVHVEIEFHGRNWGRYRVALPEGHTAWEPIQSVTFGSDVTQVGPDAPSVQSVPIPDGDWVFVFQQIVPSMGRQPESATFHLACGTSEERYPRCLIFEAYPTEFLAVGELECDVTSQAGERECRLGPTSAVDWLPIGPYEYRIPLANLGDARWSGLSVDGTTRLHAFRVNYD